MVLWLLGIAIELAGVISLVLLFTDHSMASLVISVQSIGVFRFVVLLKSNAVASLLNFVDVVLSKLVFLMLTASVALFVALF